MRRITPKQMILPIMLLLPAGLVLLFEGLKGQPIPPIQRERENF